MRILIFHNYLSFKSDFNSEFKSGERIYHSEFLCQKDPTAGIFSISNSEKCSTVWDLWLRWTDLDEL